jgi:predicted dehydrogenase
LLAGGSALAVQAAPSDQINLGVIGSGGRGTFVMTVFQKDPALRVTAICDVYEPNLESAVSTASKTPGTRPKIYRKYKELLADKDIHAVLIATPEHWHTQMVLDGWRPARTCM